MNIKAIVFLSCLYLLPCSAQIIQRNSIKAVLEEIKDEKTLVVFDIDDTLISSLSGQLTEPDVLPVLVEVKKRARCVGLTARPWVEHNVQWTKNQLAGLGISLVDGTPWQKGQQIYSFDMPGKWRGETGYKDGIIYVGGHSKGIFLMLFLMLSDCNPSHVVVIDDHLPFINAIDEQLTRYHVPHVCIHYVPSLQPK